MKKDMWIAVLASLGVGAAAYYTISKSDNPVNKAMQSVAPMLNDANGNNNLSNSNTNQNMSNNQDSNHQKNNNYTDTQSDLGPFGMS